VSRASKVKSKKCQEGGYDVEARLMGWTEAAEVWRDVLQRVFGRGWVVTSQASRVTSVKQERLMTDGTVRRRAAQD